MRLSYESSGPERVARDAGDFGLRREHADILRKRPPLDGRFEVARDLFGDGLKGKLAPVDAPFHSHDMQSVARRHGFAGDLAHLHDGQGRLEFGNRLSLADLTEVPALSRARAIRMRPGQLGELVRLTGEDG